MSRGKSAPLRVITSTAFAVGTRLYRETLECGHDQDGPERENPFVIMRKRRRCRQCVGVQSNGK